MTDTYTGGGDALAAIDTPQFAPGAITVDILESGPDRAARICCVRLRGEVDASTLVQLETRCHAELVHDTTILVLDFTGITACPSALFQVLSRIGRSFRRASGSVETVGLLEAITAIVTPGRHPDTGAAPPTAPPRY